MHCCASLCIAVLSFAVPIRLLHQVCSSFVVSLLKVLNFPSLLPISTVFPALKMFTDRFDVSKVRSHHATCPTRCSLMGEAFFFTLACLYPFVVRHRRTLPPTSAIS
jgi:hypothetical protein